MIVLGRKCAKFGDRSRCYLFFFDRVGMGMGIDRWLVNPWKEMVPCFSIKYLSGCMKSKRMTRVELYKTCAFFLFYSFDLCFYCDFVGRVAHGV